MIFIHTFTQEETQTSEESTEHEHVYKDATCTTPKTCSVCRQIEGSALVHSAEVGICSKCKEVQKGNLIKDISDNEDMDCHINNSGNVIASLGYLSTKSCGGDSVRISSFISVSPTSKSLYADFNFTMEKKVVDKWITAAMEDAKVVFSGAGEKFTIESALNCAVGYSDADYVKLRKMINSGDLTITKTGWGEKMNFDTYKNERVNYNYVYKCDDSDMEKLQKMLKVYETILTEAGITID